MLAGGSRSAGSSEGSVTVLIVKNVPGKQPASIGMRVRPWSGHSSLVAIRL